MKQLAIGQTAQTTRIFTQDEVTAYRQLTGDRGLGFGNVVAATAVPGPLLAGLFSFLLGTQLPGRGTNWLKQSLTFPSTAQIGEDVTSVVEITRLRPEKHLVNLAATCHNAAGEIVCSGETLVFVKDLDL